MDGINDQTVLPLQSLTIADPSAPYAHGVVPQVGVVPAQQPVAATMSVTRPRDEEPQPNSKHRDVPLVRLRRFRCDEEEEQAFHPALCDPGATQSHRFFVRELCAAMGMRDLGDG